MSLRAIVTPLPSGYVTAEVNGRLNGEIECGVGRTSENLRLAYIAGGLDLAPQDASRAAIV